MNRIKRFPIILLAAVVVILVLGSLNKHSKSTHTLRLLPPQTLQLYSSQPMARNLQFVSYVDDNTIRFFTGTAFAEIDLSSLHTKSLTKEFQLAKVVKVAWHNNEALLKLDPIRQSDDLYASASSSARNSSSWWLADLRSSGIREIKSSQPGYKVVDAAWGDSSSDSIFVLTQVPSSTKQTLEQQDSTGKNVTNTSTHDLQLIGYTQNGLLTQQNSELHLWLNSRFKSLGIKRISQPSILRDNRYFIYSTGIGGSKDSQFTRPLGDIFEYDTLTNRSLLLVDAGHNYGNYAVTQSGLFSLPPPPNTASGVDGNAAKYGNLTINSAPNVKNYQVNLPRPDAIETGFMNQVLIISSANNKLSVAMTTYGNDLIVLSNDQSISRIASPYPLVFLKQPVVDRPAYTLTYLAFSNKLDIRLKTPGDSSAIRQRVFQELGGQGGDPNQVYKVWRNYDPNSLE